MPQQLLDRLHQHPLRSAPGADRPQATVSNPVVNRPPRHAKKFCRLIEEKRLRHASSGAHERCLRGSASPLRGFARDFPQNGDDFAETVYPAGSAFSTTGREPAPSRQFSRSSLAPALSAYNPPHERPDDGLSRSRCRPSSAAPNRCYPRREIVWRTRRQVHPSLHLRRLRRPRAPPRPRAARPRRPPGDRVATLGWNHGPHLEAYFGIPLDGRRPAHAQPPPPPRGARLHRQPRRRPRRARRREPAAAVGTGAPAASSVPIDDRRRRDQAGAPTGYLEYEALHRDGRAGARICPTPTSAPPPRCATRPARPATRRACSTRTARSCSTRSASRSITAWASAKHDVVLPVVPMFHANAWGMPFACGDGRREAGDARAAPRSREPRRSVPDASASR